jgi:hypothetical protein
MSSRRPWKLIVGLWGAYWVALATFALGPLALAIIRATTGPDNGKSNVNVSFGDGGFSTTVVDQGRTVYTGTIGLVSAALWIAGPPLLIWLAFALRQRREERVAEQV